MKKQLIGISILSLLSNISWAQDFIDIAKVAYSNTGIGFENNKDIATLHSIDANIFVPNAINKNTFILTGVDFNLRQLPLAPVNDKTTLYNTTFRLGVSKNFNATWSGNILLLPKFAFENTNHLGASFLIGGFAILKKVRNENLTYKFGIYASREAFGLFTTPILGIFYRSPNKRLMIDATLPLSADVNYVLKNKSSTGIDFLGIRRSFFMAETPTNYVENNEINFTAYYQYKVLNDKIILRAKAGYAAANFGLYNTSDHKVIGISAITIGKERDRINATMNGGLLLKVEAAFRLNTSSNQK